MAGRAVRRHLQKANEQIGAMKTRLKMPDAGGLLILMNEAEPMIDISAIGYTLKTAFETVEGAYPHITNVWAIVESHRIAMPGGRKGLPHLHAFKSLDRLAELSFIERCSGLGSITPVRIWNDLNIEAIGAPCARSMTTPRRSGLLPVS
ncbi:hypothetical protein SP6_30_00950 [Sphingomonas paucimobilis NBRC 13935]|nr:hypothetical protein SP6_30_00950 [Sphingomonas paucimobilis NBRC 13935]